MLLAHGSLTVDTQKEGTKKIVLERKKELIPSVS